MKSLVRLEKMNLSYVRKQCAALPQLNRILVSDCLGISYVRKQCAALPQHMAVRLRLTVRSSLLFLRLCLMNLEAEPPKNLTRAQTVRRSLTAVCCGRAAG